ncbi:MAG TPA: MCE family protein [Acidimicrobiales bacterium]|nr:MCE family protein [Acidimicrobiales bacterium]
MRRRGVLLLAAALLGTVLPGCGLVGGGSYRVTAYFDRAVSVFPSSDVRVLGLPAGAVADVVIDGDRVRVDMDIDDDIQIPADATAQIVPQSLIGERYIQISPAFQDGMTPIEDGATIDNTIIPVEPDEALAALKEFLDSLDPKGIGELVTNLDEDLKGNGPALNDALGALSQLVETFAEKDQVLLRIVDSFDRLTATLATREQQLGEVMDAFAKASSVLAEERDSIEGLVSGLAHLSQEGLALVGEHAGPLRDDITTLAAAAATIDANLASVTQLLASGPQLSDGIIGAFNPELRAINLRNNFSPLTTELIDLLGVEFCLPVLQDCPTVGQTTGPVTPAAIETAPRTPVASLLDLLAAPTAPSPEAGPGGLERAGRILDGVASTLLGVDR